MTPEIDVEGIEDANRKLDTMLRNQLGRKLSERFITKALISVSANTVPFVPVDTSFLINSEYRKVRQDGQGYVGEIGYGADYAVFVHDGGPKNWQKAGASDQFLARGLDDFIRDDLDRLIDLELARL